jgi:cytochrome c biogenesis protein CcmG/thiol:disulfide interchange protein DsbE
MKATDRSGSPAARVAVAFVASAAVACAGCSRKGPRRQAPATSSAAKGQPTAPAPTMPTTAPTRPAGTASAPSGWPSPASLRPTSRPAGVARFAVGSPFDRPYKPPTIGGGKRIWARSFLWDQAPKLVVEKWLTDPPATEGKYVLVEFWATWCPPCRRSIPLLNRLHAKFGDELVVIGVSDETEAAVRRLKQPAAEYALAIDTQARTKKQLGVYGIPHVILLEPGGHVVWEGFPLLEGHELTEAVVERILSVGRKLKAAGRGAPQP